MRRIRYRQLCPIAKAAEILGERWTILIIRELLVGNSRYSGLQRALSRLSPTLLTRRLKELQEYGLVTRGQVSDRRHAEYVLSPAGRELAPVFSGLGKWGMKWARGQMRADELDVQLLMVEFSRRLDAKRMPQGSVVLEFVIPGLPKFSRWWIVVEADGSRELCTHNPGRPVNLTLRLDLHTLAEIWTGDTTALLARKQGRLRVVGDADLAGTIATWLRPGALSHIRPAPAPLSV